MPIPILTGSLQPRGVEAVVFWMLVVGSFDAIFFLVTWLFLTGGGAFLADDFFLDVCLVVAIVAMLADDNL